MNVDAAAWVQRLARVSRQRWLLASAAVATAVGASVVTGITGGGLPPLVLLIVTALAAVSAVRPDTHASSVVVGVIVWQWLVVADDPTGPAVVVVTLGLFMFHTLIALLAPAPVTATFGSAVSTRWLLRFAAVAAATVAMWMLVVLMDARRADGNAALTVAGFSVALGLVVSLVLQLSARRSQRTGDPADQV